MRYARNDRFIIRDGKADEFHRLMDAEVLPLLKNAKGFRDDLTLLIDNLGMSISVWDDVASAERYRTDIRPEVLERLRAVLATTQRVAAHEDVLTARQNA